MSNGHGDMSSSTKTNSGKEPSTRWNTIRGYLMEFTRDELIDTVIHDCYESDPEIQQALGAKFVPSREAANRLRRRVMNLVYPNPLQDLPIQPGEALRLIRKYLRISDDRHTTIAMLLDGIEAGTAQAVDLGIDTDPYFNAIEQMLKMVTTLSPEFARKDRRTIRDRLIRIAREGKGVGGGLEEMLTETVASLRQMCR
jgi:hypothetical protein